MKTCLVTVVAIAGAAALSGCQSLSLANAMAQYERTLDTYAQTDTTVTEITRSTDADGREATLLSAFFGLDSALPVRSTDRPRRRRDGRDHAFYAR